MLKCTENPSLYIHFPFCRQRCAYCAFYSQCDLSLSDDYLSALIKESSVYNGVAVKTVFIGGGTPSLIEGDGFLRLIKGINHFINFEKNAEFTMECNPESFTKTNAEKYAEAGVNRFSFGFQSADPDILNFLGRKHTFKECEKAVKISRETGIENINADVIIGTPGETMQCLKNTLEKITALELPHLSVYALSIEEGTKLHSLALEKQIYPDDDFERECYDFVCEYLYKKGYLRYEVSNFAKKGFECKHNYRCWDYSPYIGLGAAAHSFYEGYRYNNLPDIKNYIKNPLCSVEEKNYIPLKEAEEEFIMLALRTDKGLNTDKFKRLFNKDFFGEYKIPLDKHKEDFNVYNLRGDRYISLKKHLTYIQNIIIADFF